MHWQVSSQHTAPLLVAICQRLQAETSRQAKALIRSVAPVTCLRRILYASPARKLAGKLVNVEVSTVPEKGVPFCEHRMTTA